MISIPYRGQYDFEINAKCAIQLSFKVDNPQAVDQIIRSLQKKVIGLHMKLDKSRNKLLYTNNSAPIIKIPNSNNLIDSTILFARSSKINPFKRFAQIGYNDDTVILNISHAVSDGGHFKYITEHIFDDKNVDIPKHFPYTVHDLFSQQYQMSPSNIPFWDSNPNISRIISSHKDQLIKSNEVEYTTIRMPSNKFQAYSQSDKKLNSFTGSLLSSLFISHVIHTQNHFDQNYFPRSICIPTCIDFRRYLNTLNYSICSLYSIVFTSANVTPKMTLRQLGELLKNDIDKRMKNGEDFGFMKTLDNLTESSYAKNEIQKVGLELTYVGPVKIQKPIKDIFMNLSMLPEYTETILSLMGFGVCGNDMNDVILRLRYSPSTLYRDEVAAMMKDIEYTLTKIPPSTSISDAINELNKFNHGH